MVDSLLEIIIERGSQKFYKPIDVQSVSNAIDDIEVSMIFLVVKFSPLPNSWWARHEFLDHGESKIPTLLQMKHSNKAMWNRKNVFLNKVYKPRQKHIYSFTVFMLMLNFN